jgi:hypothetical protein
MMTPMLGITVLVVITQLAAAQQPYRPGVKRVEFVTPQNITPKVIQTPQALCTMPMLRPQGDVDPKIVVEPPKNGAKIRTVVVPPCIERASR